MSRSLRSVFVLIVVPAVISLGITLLVVNLWDRQQGSRERVIYLPTPEPTSMIAPRDTLPPPPEGTGEGGSPPEIEPTTAEPAGCENPTHTVAAGEVLGAISGQYGVSVDDIIAANVLVDPTFNADFLSVGQQLVIPVCGLPTPAPTQVPTETPPVTRNIPAPIPTATSLPPGSVSVQISDVISPGNVTREAVDIINFGSPINLGGWTLTNGDDQEFEFPDMTLFSNAAVTVYTRVGENTPIDLFWGLDEAVWAVGDTVYLYDDEGQLQDEHEISEE